jgi:hypothetical protein
MTAGRLLYALYTIMPLMSAIVYLLSHYTVLYEVHVILMTFPPSAIPARLFATTFPSVLFRL